MASCKKCGKAVGCGCSLKNGLCATCINESKNQVAPITVPTPITK
jgi:NMD protein affecting ribosome stability and mRNA decay